jgi:hypothetical protein
MIYKVDRTSCFSSCLEKEKPCSEAKIREFEFWHTRTCNEQEFDKNHSNREGLWRSKGKNHTITKEGYITRQQENRECWSIEINTLEELQKFIDKYGRIIIYYDQSIKANVIKIYDDYRE